MQITINYEPTPKGVPRTKFVNGMVITYYNKKTNDALENIRAILISENITPFPKHIPIKLVATFYRTKSKWLPRREQTPFRKPDLDNFLKLTIDTISKIVIPDDAQITTLVARKRWSNNGNGYIMLDITEDSDA